MRKALLILTFSLFYHVGLTFQSTTDKWFDHIVNSIKYDFSDSTHKAVNTYYNDAIASNDERWLLRAHILKGKLLTIDSLDKAITHFRQALRYSRSTRQSIFESELLIELGFLHKNHLRKSDSAAIYFQKAFEIAKREEKYLQIIHARTALSYLDMDDGNYPKAVERLLQNRAIIDSINAPVEKARLYNNLGHVYMTLGLHTDAIPLFDQAYYLTPDSISESTKKLYVLNKLEALIAVNKSADVNQLIREIEDKHVLDFSKDDLRFYQLLSARWERINRNYNKALTEITIASQLGEDLKIYDMNVPIEKAKILMELKRYANAHALLLDAYDTLRDINPPIVTESQLEKLLAESHEILGDYKSSITHLNRHLMLHDMIHNERVISQFLIKEIRERMTQQEKQAALEKELLNQKIETESKQFFLAIIIASLLAIILFTLLFAYRQKLKNARKLSAKNEELIQQKMEIESQAIMLKEANEKIQNINQKLEALLSEKVNEVEEKNKKLDEYAFINSHKLRSPIAAIKGIINILPSVNIEKRDELLEEIYNQAEYLDNIVHEIRDVVLVKSSISEHLTSPVGDSKEKKTIVKKFI